MEYIKFDETKADLVNCASNINRAPLIDEEKDLYAIDEYERLNKMFDSKLDKIKSIKNLVITHTLDFSLYTYITNNMTDNIAVVKDNKPVFFGSYSNISDGDIEKTKETYASYENGILKDKITISSIKVGTTKIEDVETFKSNYKIDTSYGLYYDNKNLAYIRIKDGFEDKNTDNITELKELREKIYAIEKRIARVIVSLTDIRKYEIKRNFIPDSVIKDLENYKRKQMIKVIDKKVEE